MTAPIAPALLSWFKQHGRHHLAWQRSPANPYYVWLSEIMLQQTQVTTVSAYFERFIRAFPSIEALAHGTEEEVMAQWAGLGYYRRARYLHQTAKIIVQDHQGQLPQDIEVLQSLPGIGPSTAGAIASQAYHLPTPILDGNVKRVLTRLTAMEGYPEDGPIKKKLWQLAKQWMPLTHCADYTQAIMDLGATVCTRHQPLCHECPLQNRCQAYQQQRVSEFPFKKPRKKNPVRHSTLLLAYTKDHVYLIKRPRLGIWGDLWACPELPSSTYGPRLPQHIITPLPVCIHPLTHLTWHIHPLTLKFESCCPLGFAWGQWHPIQALPPLPRPLTKMIDALKDLVC